MGYLNIAGLSIWFGRWMGLHISICKGRGGSCRDSPRGECGSVNGPELDVALRRGLERRENEKRARCKILSFDDSWPDRASNCTDEMAAHFCEVWCRVRSFLSGFFHLPYKSALVNVMIDDDLLPLLSLAVQR
jgi:hypothetical protein